MQVVCFKNELLRGIQTVQSAVSTKNTLPILSNILLETKTNQLKLVSTDLQVGVRCLIKAEIVKNGALTLPARTFGEFIRTLQEGQEIEIKAEDASRIEIRCGKTRCMLLGLPREEFPVLPEFPEDKAIVMDVKTLREMIKKTSFAVSTDETRYILNGIDFILDKGTAKMVATDGRRLSYVARAVSGSETPLSAIIPLKAMIEVEHLLGAEEAGDQTVKVHITGNQVAFKAGDTVIISRLIEGHFPNYEQVIPQSSDIHVQVPTRDLLLMTQRAALGSGDRGGAVRFALEKGRLRALGTATGRVEIEDEMPINFSGPPFEIAFNPGFVLDILKNMDTPQVSLEFTTSLNPGVIRPVGDEQTLCVIMPMRT